MEGEVWKELVTRMHGAISNDLERTPLIDAKYLTNGYIYGYSYYRRRIENRIPKLLNGTNFNDLE